MRITITTGDGWLLREAVAFAVKNNYGTPTQRSRLTEFGEHVLLRALMKQVRPAKKEKT